MCNEVGIKTIYVYVVRPDEKANIKLFPLHDSKLKRFVNFYHGAKNSTSMRSSPCVLDLKSSSLSSITSEDSAKNATFANKITKRVLIIMLFPLEHNFQVKTDRKLQIHVGNVHVITNGQIGISQWRPCWRALIGFHHTRVKQMIGGKVGNM